LTNDLIINDIFGFGRGEILLSKQTKKPRWSAAFIVEAEAISL